MKKMLYFEFRKIFQRRLNIVAMLAGYVLIAVCVVVFVKSCSFYDEETGKYIYGIEAVKRDEERNRALTDCLTEEFLTGLTEEMQATAKDLDEDHIYSEIARRTGDLFFVIVQNYTDYGEVMNYGKIKEIPTQGGIHFYERRMERLENFLNMDFTYGNYAEEEKNFWITMAQEVETPFSWGAPSTMSIVWDTIEIGFYLILVIAVCISPVFAAEYETGAVALLLTTKHGKGRLIYAKILASVLFALAYMTLGIGAGVAAEGIAIGFQGAELPVQLRLSVIPYDWNMGQTCLITFGVELLIALTVTLFVAFCSSRLKGSIGTLVVSFLILIGPAFLKMSRESRLWNHILYLLPVSAMNTKDVISTFNSYLFGSTVISYLGMIVIVYVCIGVLCSLGTKGGFARHQVRN